MRRMTRRLMVPAVGAALAVGGFAFMATNNIPATNAGASGQTISGYTVSDVHYAIVTNPRTPSGTYIQQVTFKLSPSGATNVLAWFEDGSGNFVSGYYSCSENTSSGVWDCQNPNVINGHQWSDTGQAHSLHVSAAQ